MRKILVIAASASASAAVLSFVTQTAQAQSQWALIDTTDSGERVYFDVVSQRQIFDTGIKTSNFRTVTTSSAGASLRGARYEADCFRGTLALRAIERVTRNGVLIQSYSLKPEDKAPVIPAQGSVGESILRYACKQF